MPPSVVLCKRISNTDCSSFLPTWQAVFVVFALHGCLGELCFGCRHKQLAKRNAAVSRAGELAAQGNFDQVLVVVDLQSIRIKQIPVHRCDSLSIKIVPCVLLQPVPNGRLLRYMHHSFFLT